MHDHFEESYEWVDGIPRKKKRAARDGETIHFPYIADHAAFGFSPVFADGSPDLTNPHRPGYRFADTTDAARTQADEAYAARSHRMEAGWRQRGDAQAADSGERKSPSTLDEARAAADAAYLERSKRMQNAWKQREQ
jgi:hypothetical protein